MTALHVGRARRPTKPSTVRPAAIPTHVVSVAAVTRPSAGYLRVTLAGGLERYVPKGPDDFLYVLLPPPGRRELTVDESFRWSDYDAMPEGERPVGAYYTVRSWRPDAGELDLDVFLHDPAGTVSTWVRSAAPGDPVALWGPRTAWTPPEETTSWLLVADETGVPAVRAILEQRPVDLPARCFLEVDSIDDHEPIATGAGVEVSWLERHGAPAGRTSLLLDAVRAEATVDRTTYVWGGAESRAMTAIRRHVRRQRGLAKPYVSLTPYWRHAAHADDLPDDDED